MSRWYKPQEYFKKFFRKKDLREVCRDKYGDDFVEMYDMVNNGIPIGNLRETQIFLAMVKAAEEGRVMNARACKGCRYFVKHYGNKDSQGKRTVSNYWCVAKNGFIRNFPKQCKLKREKEA